MRASVLYSRVALSTLSWHRLVAGWRAANEYTIAELADEIGLALSTVANALDPGYPFTSRTVAKWIEDHAGIPARILDKESS